MTIDDYSPLFALFVLFAIRDNSLFAIRDYSLFAIRGFETPLTTARATRDEHILATLRHVRSMRNNNETSVSKYGVLLTPKCGQKKSFTQKLRYFLKNTRHHDSAASASAPPLGSAASLAIIFTIV